MYKHVSITLDKAWKITTEERETETGRRKWNESSKHEAEKVKQTIKVKDHHIV